MADRPIKKIPDLDEIDRIKEPDKTIILGHDGNGAKKINVDTLKKYINSGITVSDDGSVSEIPSHNHSWSDITNKPDWIKSSAEDTRKAINAVDESGVKSIIDSYGGGSGSSTTTPTTPSTGGSADYVPSSRKINGYNLKNDITLKAADISDVANIDHDHDWNDITGKPTWIKTNADQTRSELNAASTDHDHTWNDITSKPAWANSSSAEELRKTLGDIPTMSDVETKIATMASGGSITLEGFVPTSRTINGQPLTTDITLNTEDSKNKVTSINSSNNDNQYPSAKAVYTELSKKIDKPTSSVGSTTKGIYLDSTGTPKAMLYSLNANVPTPPSSSTEKESKYLRADGNWATPNTSITVDTALNASSTNPVQNKVINSALANKAGTDHNHNTVYPTFANAYNASNMNAGTLNKDLLPTVPLNKGGTGQTLSAAPAMLVNLASTATNSPFIASPRPGVTGKLPIANGGTNATTVAEALTNLGAASVSHDHDTVYASKAIATNSSNGLLSASDKQTIDKLNGSILNSVAIGYNVSASTTGSISIGSNSRSTNVQSIALGVSANINGSYGVAIGYMANAKSSYAISIGCGATISNTSLTPENAVAIGHDAKASGIRDIAIGYNANSYHIDGVAIGANSIANSSVAIGSGANGKGSESTAIGWYSNASKDATVAVGGLANANAVDAVAVGYTSNANGSSSIAIGYLCKALSTNSVAIGHNANSSTIGSISIGANANGAGAESIAIGVNANTVKDTSVTTCNYPIAIGHAARTSMNYGIAIGCGSNTSGINAIAIGHDTNAVSNNTISIGNGANGSYANAIAIGNTAIANASQSIAIGNTSWTKGLYSIALGKDARAFQANCIAIGHYSDATNTGSIALGAVAVATNSSYSMALGHDSYANANYSIGLGYRAKATAKYAVAIGYNAVASVANSIQLGNENLSNIYAGKTTIATTSDIRDKADVTEIGDGATDFLCKIRAIRYVFNGRSLYEEEEVWTEEEVDTGEVDEDGNPITKTVRTCNLSEEERSNRAKYGLGSYDKEAHAAGTKKGERVRVGVAAQEILSALTDVYGDDSYGNLVNDNFHDIPEDERPKDVENQYSVNYTNFIPFLIKSVQELNGQIKNLNDRIKALEG